MELYYASQTDYKTFVYIGAVQGITQTGMEAAASVDLAGNIYFTTGISYPQDYNSIWRGTFSNGNVTNLAAVQGISKKTTGWFNMDAGISPDGKTLYFSDNGAVNGVPTSTLVVARKNLDGSFTRLSNSASILQNVNALYGDHVVYAPCISNDGLELFFTGPDPMRMGPGIYVAKRNSASAVFGLPQLISAATGPVEAPSLSNESPHGKHLYYHQIFGTNYVKTYVVTRP